MKKILLFLIPHYVFATEDIKFMSIPNIYEQTIVERSENVLTKEELFNMQRIKLEEPESKVTQALVHYTPEWFFDELDDGWKRSYSIGLNRYEERVSENELYGVNKSNPKKSLFMDQTSLDFIVNYSKDNVYKFTDRIGFDVNLKEKSSIAWYRGDRLHSETHNFGKISVPILLKEVGVDTTVGIDLDPVKINLGLSSSVEGQFFQFRFPIQLHYLAKVSSKLPNDYHIGSYYKHHIYHNIFYLLDPEVKFPINSYILPVEKHKEFGVNFGNKNFDIALHYQQAKEGKYKTVNGTPYYEPNHSNIGLKWTYKFR